MTLSFLKVDGSAVEQAKDHRQGKIMQRGRTEARVKGLESDLDRALQTLSQEKETRGELIAEGGEPAAIKRAEDAVNRAANQVQGLESALVVAIRKDEAALAELTEATVRVAIETEYAALDYLARKMGPKVDQMIEDLKHISQEVQFAIEQCFKAGISDQQLVRFNDAKLYFSHFVLAAISPMSNKPANPLVRKYEKWSQALPDPETARTRPR